MLVYRRVEDLDVVGYTDANIASCPNNERSTFGYIFMLVGGPVS